jgi:hypothetical protein
MFAQVKLTWKMMPKYCLLFCLLSRLAFTAAAQAPDSAVAFPEGWRGVWSGQLNIYNGAGALRSVDMELHILPLAGTPERHAWKIVYGEADARDYRLLTVDAAKGHYRIDEQNSIVLDAFLLNGKLYCLFDVVGTLLLSTVEKKGDILEYEIISGPIAPLHASGGLSVEGQEIPPVRSYETRTRHVARLRLKE